jgi:hypothetical protein
VQVGVEQSGTAIRRRTVLVAEVRTSQPLERTERHYMKRPTERHAYRQVDPSQFMLTTTHPIRQLVPVFSDAFERSKTSGRRVSVP